MHNEYPEEEKVLQIEPNATHRKYKESTLIYHLGLYNRPEVAAVPGDVSPTP
jgi:hypothetical protein